MKTSRFDILLVVIIIITFSFLGQLLAKITVTSSGWRPPVVHPFPANSPPPDLKDANADANSSVGGSGRITRGKYKDPNFKPTEVVVDVNGGTVIREPNNCDPNLHGHEMGHDELSKWEFDRNAVKKMEDAMKGFDEMVFTGEGNTPGARYKDAANKAAAELQRRLDAGLAAIQEQVNNVNVKYDELTGHGTKEDPNTSEGVEEAKKEFSTPAEPGSVNVVPRDDPNDPNVPKGTGPSGATVDPNSKKMELPGRTPLSNSQNPVDPINGRGQAGVNKMIVIGMQENGTLHLSGTTMDIIDACEPYNVLMKGFICNVCYRPSNLEGFGGMVQGYLDIPPSIYGGGINNTIGSPWLEQMQAAADRGEYMCFWFYSFDEMFDEDGNWLLGPDTAEGQMVLGIGKEIFDEIDRFEQYSPVSFYTQWLPVGNGVPELSSDHGHSSNKSMMLMYDTINPPMFSGAMHTFMPPADWTEPQHKVLEVYFDLSESPENCADNVYVELEDTMGHIYHSGYFTPADYDQLILAEPSIGWESLNIDLRNAAASGLMLDSIASIRIGVENVEGPPATGVIFVDDIRIQDARQIGEQKYDLTGDGTVNLSDFARFADKWLDSTIWPE